MPASSTKADSIRLQRVALFVLLTISSVGSSSRASSAPASAREEGQGLLVLTEVWWLQPRNLDLDYALIQSGVATTIGGEVQTLSHDRRPVTRLYAGWRLESAPSVQLGATFLEYDDRSSVATGFNPRNVAPSLASPFSPFLGFPATFDSATAESHLQLTLVDAGFRFHHGLGEHGALRVDAELRFFRYQRTTQVRYRRDDLGEIRDLFVNSTSDARGIGPRVALSYAHRFGRRFGVTASLGFAMPVGKLEARDLQEFVMVSPPPEDLLGSTLAEQPGTRRAFFQIDSEIALEVHLWKGWDASLSYGFQQWSDVQSNLRFVDFPAQGTAVGIREDTVFEGFLLGVRYAF